MKKNVPLNRLKKILDIPKLLQAQIKSCLNISRVATPLGIADNSADFNIPKSKGFWYILNLIEDLKLLSNRNLVDELEFTSSESTQLEAKFNDKLNLNRYILCLKPEKNFALAYRAISAKIKCQPFGEKKLYLNPKGFVMGLTLIFTFISGRVFADSKNLKNEKSQNLEYEIVAKKLDKSRSNISPKTGSSSFGFKRDDIDKLPQGQATSLNQVLLRSPSAAQDSYGQIHVRGEHSNLQYRINDIIIPDGITGFGQALDARFADSVDLITGALPAQYGYRTAGVIEIKTKDRVSDRSSDKTSEISENGGYSEVQVGTNDHIGFNQQLSGNKKGFNYFVSGSYLENNRGLESPTGARNSIHNDTTQDKFFGYFSYLLNPEKRVGLILANSTNRFQIPNIPDKKQQYNLSGANAINSKDLNQNQREENRFAIASLQGVDEKVGDYQIAAFTRESRTLFRGDYVGDLIFSGTASNIDRTSVVSGVQGDFSKELDEKNNLRVGFYVSDTAVSNSQGNSVFSANRNSDGELEQTSTTPFAINSGDKTHSQLYSIYAQNEYQPTEKLKLNFGGRYDKANVTISEQQFSPRAGSVYELNEQTKLHAGYARYFTAPKAELITNLNLQSFRDTTNEPHNFNNGSVKAERSDYYDLGVAHKFENGINLALNGFYKDSKNMLDEGQFGNALIFKPFNYAKGKTHGVELASDFKKENLSLFGNVTWQKNIAKRINSGQYLHEESEINHTAKHYVNSDHAQLITASAGAAYKFSATKTELGFDGLYGNGLRRGDLNKNRMPSYWQLNLFAIQKVAKFNFRLAINNVLDRRYALRDGSGIGVQASQFAMRRNVMLISSYEF